MASILDALGATDIRTARLAQQARAKQARTEQAQALGKNADPLTNIGLQFGSAFGGGLADELLPAADSPDVLAAKQNKAVLDEIAGLTEREENPLVAGTPDFLVEQAQILQNAGRTDLALQSLSEAQRLRKAEAQTTRTQSRQDAADVRSESAEERAQRAEQRAIEAADLAERRFQASLGKDAKGKGLAIGVATKPELTSTATALEEAGITSDFLNPGFGDNDEGLAQLTGRLAQAAKTAAQLRKQKGEKVQIDQVMREFADKLKAQPFFETQPNQFTSGNTLKNDFNIGDVDNFLDQELRSLQSNDDDVIVL